MIGAGPGGLATARWLLSQGFDIEGLPSPQFRAYFEAEVAKYARLVTQARIEPQ